MISRTNAPVPPRGGGLCMIAREPHLGLAVEAEEALACLYERLAALDPDSARRARWRQASTFTRTVVLALKRLCDAGAPVRHHPRPTRIRLTAFRSHELRRLVGEICTVTGQCARLSSSSSLTRLLSRVRTLEREAVSQPLLRISSMAPSPQLYGACRAVVLRCQLLERMGVEAKNAGPATLDGSRVPRRLPSRHSPGGRGPGKPPEAFEEVQGTVKQLNLFRRCGTAVTEAGHEVFFCAKAVYGGLPCLNEGDVVRLTVRKGPLGWTAARVEAVPAGGPGARPPASAGRGSRRLRGRRPAG